MKLFLTGERFDGQQAVDMGLAHVAVPEDQLINSVEEQISMINLGGPIAVQECKKLARRVPQLSIEEGFKETAEWSAHVSIGRRRRGWRLFVKSANRVGSKTSQ